ncbi:MAG: formate dehydrogenase subunit alpha [Betaproteobacteria bacterium]
MNAPRELKTLQLEIDGKTVTALEGQTLWQAARGQGTTIPHLCHAPDHGEHGLRAQGNCRACVVEVQGERTLSASCCRTVQPGMVVHTATPRVQRAQRLVLELLRADVPPTPEGQAPLRHDSELDHWCEDRGVSHSRFAPRPAVPADTSHPAMKVNLSACIQCTRCVRACRDEQGNDVIGLAFRGGHAQIVFDQRDPMGESTCVACGECVQACPTGALSPANGSAAAAPTRRVDSVCPFCGVGCQLTYLVADAPSTARIVGVEGRSGPANAARLCVKGRFGFDYVHHADRLRTPLIRRADAPKDPLKLKPAHWSELFRPASWAEALDVAAQGLRRLRDQHGPQALAGFGSAKGSNEEAYLFQKLVRTGFGTHNVDHCTRLCHASSVAALLEGIGSGAVSNPVRDVAQAEVVLLIGANPTVNHPVAASFIKNAVAQGTKLILADPRRTELQRQAWRTLAFKADTDVALLNALLHTIVDEGLVDEAFVRDRTEDFEDLKRHLKDFSPETMAPVCGIDAPTLREVARTFATSRASMILWGMGVSQHVHGTGNARALIALAMITGQIGRPGTGLHPLRGQNNVQGASDAGLIPMMLPDYQRVTDPAVRAHFEQAWGLAAGTLPAEPGLTVVEVMKAIHAGTVRGMFIEGENPAMSDPDAGHARQALAALEHLVVQDIFLTETAALADVVLPASAWPEKTGTVTNTDRLMQLGRPALLPPGNEEGDPHTGARADAWILEQLAQRLGLPWAYGIDPLGAEAGVGAVHDEMRSVMPSIAGISWARLQRDGAVTYPCADEADPGQAVVFTDHFPTASGRARLVPSALSFAAERPDAQFPFVLITGRQLEHWHTGSMTRHATVLDALEPAPTVSLHPLTLARLGVQAGQRLRVSSRRGHIELMARADEATPADTVFIPFAYAEAAANLLTNPALDPVAKIAEVKYCAVAVEPAPV